MQVDLVTVLVGLLLAGAWLSIYKFALTEAWQKIWMWFCGAGWLYVLLK